VELGHCADHYRYGAGKGSMKVAGAVLTVPRLLASLQFSETQELEADAFAARLAASRRRDPRAGLRALRALGLREDRRTKRGYADVAVEAVGDYFSTHPGSWERLAALEREIAKLERAR
jgi:Zn-dependent protease with chaperone function